MSRGPNPRNQAIRALLVHSGNRCAFPGCDQPILNERHQFVAQVCHIEAAARGGPRYNIASSDEERRDHRNLLLLCYRHHVETDDVDIYPAAILRDMKERHEAAMATRPFAVPESVVEAIARDTHRYWDQVETANRVDHIVPSLRVPIDTGATPAMLFTGIREALDRLAGLHTMLTESAKALPREVDDALRRCGYDIQRWQDLPYYENPTFERDWEVRALGLQNFLTDAHILLDQLELRYLEMASLSAGTDGALAERIALLRARFLEAARSAGYAD